MKIKLLLVTLCATLLYGCDAVSVTSGGVGDLLSAPTLNRMQAEIYNALEATIHLPDIVFKYPNQGDNRTPFVFYDLNGDGSEEAIVFYSYVERPNEIRAKVLKQDTDEGWYSFSDIPGQGDQIDFVEFANIASHENISVLIGWQNKTRGEYLLGIYSLDDESFKPDALHKYVAYSMADFGGSELSRALIVTRENRNSPYELIMFGGSNGKVRQTDSLTLYEDVESILKMTKGRLWNGSLAVFVDELFDNETVATEIIRVTPWGFETVAGAGFGEESPQWAYYVDTFRPDKVLSFDVDKDERIEVPRNIFMPGTEESDEQPSPLMLTVYRRPTSEGLDTVCTAAVNESGGYLVVYPEKWLEQVQVVSYPELNQWRFYRVDERSLEATVELLRITRYQSRDYASETSVENILLDTRGAMRYYGYIPPASADDPLSITETELILRMFSLMQ